MRAVKNGNLALFIGPDILYETDIKRVTFEPQRLRQRLRPLDNEQPEVFGGIQESIMVAQLRFELFRFFNELILEVNPTITAVATLLMLFTVLALGATALLLRRAGRLRETLL